MLGVAWDAPDAAAATWAKVRGNRFAKAGLEMACWDLFTRVRGEPLAGALGGTRREIHSGVSLGIEPTVEGIVEQVERYLDQGYRRIKMKIGPGPRPGLPARRPRALARRAADGRRQLGLLAWTTPSTWRRCARSTTST